MANLRSKTAIPSDLIATLTKLPRLQSQLRDMSQDVSTGIPEAVQEALDVAEEALELAERTQAQAFLLVAPSPDLPSARGLTVGTGLSTVDSGPGDVFQIRLQAFLAALSLLTGNGIVVKTPAGAQLRAIEAGSARVEIMNADGVTGNPAIDIDEPSLDVGNMGGTLGIAHGGSGVTVLSAFSAHNNAVSQSIPSSTNTKVLFSTEAFDVAGDFASSSWTPAAGRPVLIQGSIYLNITEPATVQLVIRKNGAPFKAGPNRITAGAEGVRVAASCIDMPATGDVYELWVFHSATVAQGTSGAQVDTWFSGSML